MKSIRDYRGGHAGRFSPGKPTTPDENDGLYRAHVSNLLVQGDYAQLEKIAAQNRTDKGRLLGGFWKNFEFFSGTAYPPAFTDADYLSQMEMLKKWIAAYPESAAARISLAELYIACANFARGSGFANSVTSSQWQL